MEDLEAQLKSILTPEKSLAVYHLKWRDPPGTILAGTEGAAHFLPNPDATQAYYDLIFHSVLIPLSTIPLTSLLALNLADLLLPAPSAADYPEQCLGLITILDQTRILTSGTYNARYTRCFFDPLCESLARQLVALPESERPDGKQAWLSRGYTFSQWLARVLMIWAPLVHSDTFMVQHRQRVKDFLRSMRSEVETHYSVTDPYAPLEAADDVDLKLFPRMIAEGPPERSFTNPNPNRHPNPEEPLPIWDYAFWWIRILNAHFALTDYCGHYPYAREWHGQELTERDREYLEKTENALYDVRLKPVFEQVKRDVREGVWRPLEPIERYEVSQ